jgi:glutathione peroxidase
MKVLHFLTAAVCLPVMAFGQAGGSLKAASTETAVSTDYLHLPLKTISGETTNLAAYDGQVVLLVNVASKCGFTPQYTALEALYNKYKGRGFVIIGFPANNFLKQEPGTDAEILTFCQTKYNVTFPLMSKISVSGKDQHPLYAYLTKDSPVPGRITWNFNKFLVDRSGKVVARFDSKTKPDDPELVAKIETLLGPPK